MEIYKTMKVFLNDMAVLIPLFTFCVDTDLFSDLKVS